MKARTGEGGEGENLFACMITPQSRIEEQDMPYSLAWHILLLKQLYVAQSESGITKVTAMCALSSRPCSAADRSPQSMHSSYGGLGRESPPPISMAAGKDLQQHPALGMQIDVIYPYGSSTGKCARHVHFTPNLKGS